MIVCSQPRTYLWNAVDPLLHICAPQVPLTIKLTERLEPWPLRTNSTFHPCGHRPPSQSPPQVSVAPPSLTLGSSLCCILRSARPPRRLSSVCPLLSHTYCDCWHLLSVQVLSEHCYWPGLTRLSALNTPLAPTFLLLCVASARCRVSTSQLCFSRTTARSTPSFRAPRHYTFLPLGLLPVLSNLHL